MLSKLLKYLGLLTDLLSVGRKAGWWKRGQEPDWKDKDGV